MPTLRTFACVLVILLAGGASRAASQDATQPATQPQKSRLDREMTVSPAKAEDALPAEQRPSVFAFSQDALELRNENAATLYLQAFPQSFGRTQEQWTEAMDQLEGKRILGIDLAAARKSLEGTGYPGAALDISEPAVRRTWADWGAPLQEQGIATLLPYLNESRILARTMALEARLLALEGKHEESANMLRRIYVMGLHIGNARQPVLIEGLVGVGIASLATDRAAQIAELENAPNRYWALTTLPTPMFDMPRWTQSERIFLTVSFPVLREPELMTAARWGETVGQLRILASEQPNPTTAQATVSAFVATMQATQYLKSRGYTQDQIEKLDLFPTVARMMLDEYYEKFDAVTKLTHLPFPQAYPRMVELEERLVAAREREGATGASPSLATMLMPSLTRAAEAPWRLERQIAALRIVEAVRDHAAQHEGALPKSLAELRLPVPEDPMTGEAFDYAAQGDTFTITAPKYRPSDVQSGFVWRVKMRGM